MKPFRIDTHHHIVPPVWARALQEQSYFGGQATPLWSLTAALDTMDELSIATAIVSVGRPGVSFGAHRESRSLSRAVNEFAAEMVRSYPDRFSFFASLPIADLDGSLAEIEYAIDVLHADGVILLTNHDGTYLGDPSLNRLMDELNQRKAVAFIHPTAPPGPAVPGVPSFSADFLLDTTRATLNLVRHGAMSRWPDLRMILAHAGGFIPYAAHRIAALTEGAGGHQVTREGFLGDLRSFWYDTALSSGPATLAALLTFADPTRVLYGSDWPYARGDNSQYFTRELDEYPMDREARNRINTGNALSLWPHLAHPRHRGTDRPKTGTSVGAPQFAKPEA